MEIGFRFFDEIRTKGNTAYSDLSFIKSLNFRDQTSIGIMINGSDIVKFKNNKKIIDYFLDVLKSKRLGFVRIACHIKELDQISFFIKKIRLKKKKIMINLMQISEIKKKQIRSICKKVRKLNPDVFYIADSLGSMKPYNFNIVIKEIKKFWHGEIEFIHNNKRLALKNTILANSLGVNWLDCTITGMGRGAGNTITEELLRKKHKTKFSKLNNNLISKFRSMKKKYKWGPSQIYSLAADYKIHPTYVQLLLTGKPFAEYRNNIQNVLRNLKSLHQNLKLINYIFL